jgi:hypothetical protein
VTPEQIRRAATKIVERSTAASGVPWHIEAPEVLDPLADAVIEAGLASRELDGAPGGDADAA